jgi:hypothetical protein
MDRIKYQRSLDPHDPDRDDRQDEFSEEEPDRLENEDKDDYYAERFV